MVEKEWRAGAHLDRAWCRRAIGGKLENAVGLAMTGGGARGAYQAGVLKRIGEVKRIQTQGNPFPIVGGASAGAVNGTAVAVGADDFAVATKVLAQLWSDLKPDHVFRCDLMAQTRNSLTWIMDLSFGGVLGGGNARSLLDATPLRGYLNEHLDCGRIQDNIRKGHLYALAITATNYGSGTSYLFIQGAKGHPMWQRSRRVTLATKITVDHVCASAAIPVVFPPVQLKTPLGTAFFGDGCMRLQQPLSPIIRLGADRVFAIGVRCESLENQEDSHNGKPPSLAEVAGLLCNVMFLDHLASDIEHLERLNELLKTGQLRKPANGSQEMRPLKTFYIAPSIDLAQVAAEHRTAMPYLISYFVNSLGRGADSCSDLMSYLLFTPEYTNALIDIGYHDADERIDEIEDFIYSSRD